MYYKDYVGRAGIIIGIILIVAIAFSEHKINTTTRTFNDISMGEWISPDGVHYWYGSYGNQGYLAPRYNNNGNLVIDSECE